MKVRGHTLHWHRMVQNWIFRNEKGKNASKEVVLERLRNHKTEVVGHYEGRVYAWDVINKAVVGCTAEGTDSGEDAGLVDHYGFRDSKWYQICGVDYIIEAFRAARADRTIRCFLTNI